MFIYIYLFIYLFIIRTSLVVQWLRLCTSITGGMGSIPCWGTKIPHAAQHGQKKNRKQQQQQKDLL